MTKLKSCALGCFAGIFFLFGLFIFFCIPGFQFSAYIFFGIAGVFLCYQLLHLLRRHHPKGAKIMLWLLSAILIIGIILAVITGIPIARAAKGNAEENCQYVIVLGAGVNGTVPSLSLRERLDAAYAYLTDNPEAICIVSGGQGNGEDITEALCMFNDLTARGIDKERVWMEEHATSTRENIALSLALIEEKTGDKPIKAGIISSEYHLYRANLFAREQNLAMVGIPAKTSWLSLRINYFLREIVAVWYYTILGG